MNLLLRKFSSKLLSKLEVPRPLYATMEEWNDWGKQARKNYPIRYFLFDTLITAIRVKYRRWVIDPIWWIRYRTTDNHTIIKIKSLEPGFHDAAIQMLHFNFQLLVNHLEYLYHSNIFSKGKPKKEKMMDTILDNLDWQINSPDCKHGPSPTQSERAAEKKMLYLWWKIDRVNRIDPYNHFSIWETIRWNESTPYLFNDEEQAAYKLAEQVDLFYRQEDDEMLSKLINLRESLWY